MEMEHGSSEILALSEMLSGLQNREEEEEEERGNNQFTPSSLINNNALPEIDRPIGQIKPVDPKAIWQLEEVPSDDELEECYETRVRPNFEIKYMQNVMTEDVFLGLSDKDPSSAHCEAMVVVIQCPKHKLEDIELQVKKQKILLESSTLKLSLYLPYPVRHQDGQAKWNGTKQELAITLPIIRDEW